MTIIIKIVKIIIQIITKPNNKAKTSKNRMTIF